MNVRRRVLRSWSVLRLDGTHTARSAVDLGGLRGHNLAPWGCYSENMLHVKKVLSRLVLGRARRR